MNIQDLLEKFRLFSESEHERVKSKMKFDYSRLPVSRYKRIIEALVFWEFVRVHLGNFDWKTRREFLFHSINHSKNKLSSTIAMLESMPTSMFRRILWKYNIDFMFYAKDPDNFVVFEHFLRRLEVSQTFMIEENFSDLFINKKVPRVFSRFSRFFKGITVDKLLAEESDGLKFERRYARKGSWSYNLLDLGFGFNQYPEGGNSDYKNVEVSPLTFLSHKKHSDDFVVNTEFGLYWIFYRLARSNYVWFPNRDVRLKTHICPGFWYTLFIHFLFWIASPLAALFIGSILATYGLDMFLHPFSSWIGTGLCVLLIPAAVTPLWLSIAALKFIFSFIFRHILSKKVRTAIDDWVTINDDNITLTVVIAFATVVIVLITYC
ncbi:MAG: hypothetical protein KKC05_03580, partial [Nanoarchaeota archaeon]|nr:hypothetical protein [Nanoarchaeota archaeon]